MNTGLGNSWSSRISNTTMRMQMESLRMQTESLRMSMENNRLSRSFSNYSMGIGGFGRLSGSLSDIGFVGREMFNAGGGRMVLTMLGDLSSSTFPVARALAKVGGVALSGVTLGRDIGKFYTSDEPAYMQIHDAALIFSGIISWGGMIPSYKPLRWTSTAMHVWDIFTQDLFDRWYEKR